MKALKIVLQLALCALVTPFSLGASASESAKEWVPIGTVISSTGSDMTQMAYAVARCSALHYALAKSFQSRADTAEMSAQFEKVGTGLLVNYVIFNDKIAGRDSSSSEQMQAYTDTVLDFTNGYIEAFSDNWTRSGSYITGDTFIEQEVANCRGIASALGH